MKARRFICFFLLLPALQVSAQQWNLIDSLSLSEPQVLTCDPSGNIYVFTGQNALHHINRSEIIRSQASSQLSGLTHLEAFHMLKLFAFYRDQQTFQFFDRFLTPGSRQSIKDPEQGTYSAATLSSDQMIWLVDEANLRLKKYHPILEEMMIDADLKYYLEGGFDISYAKEYGNRLYLKNGDNEIILFDTMGNFIGKVNLPLGSTFFFNREYLYSQRDDELFVYELGSMQSRRITLAREADHFLWVDRDAYLFADGMIFRYRFDLD